MDVSKEKMLMQEKYVTKSDGIVKGAWLVR